MRSWLALLVLICIGPVSLCQDSFEPGYIINPARRQITCLIKEPYWKNNPTKIEYKFFFNDSLIEGTVENIIEFGVGKHTKYKSAELDIDESSDRHNELKNEKAPLFVRQKVFLRVLLEGDGSLFEVITPKYTRFFYQKPDSAIKPLIYKLYQDSTKTVDYNYTFRTQLNKEMNCGFLSARIQSINYNKPELIHYFKTYNTCIGNVPIKYSRLARPFKFAMKTRIRLDSYDVFIETDHDLVRAIKPSVEIEALLPFYKSRWALFTEPAYQSFQSDPVYYVVTGIYLNYKGIELPIGVRYYLKPKLKNGLFLNSLVAMDLPFNNALTFQGRGELEYLKSSIAIGLGGGISIDRWDTQLRWYSPRNLDFDLAGLRYGFRRWSFYIGYRFY